MRLPRPGDMFQAKYEVQRTLGQGASSAVYLARDVEVRREVAIKVLVPEVTGYAPGAAERFLIEARVIASLQDRHTIRMFDFGQTDAGLLYMVFQYVAGTDLASLLEARGALAPHNAVHVAVQVLAALAEAHAAGVLHRDIKPANVLIHDYMGDPYAAKLLDFGIAKVEEHGGPVLTKTGFVVGTPGYMAPEQLFGKAIGPPADIFAVGVLLFEMLVGHTPAENAGRDILTHYAGNDPLTLPDGVASDAIRHVVERMLARAPADRFASADSAANALKSALQDRSTSQASRPVATSRAPSPKASWMGWLVAIASFIFLGVVAFATLEGPPLTVQPTPRALPTRLLSSPVVPTPPPVEIPDVAITTDGQTDVGSSVDGCGRDVGPYEEERWLRAGGRQVRVHLPPDYDPDARYPLILGYQPKFLTPQQYGHHSGLNPLAKEHPVIVALPEPSDITEPWSDHDAEVRRAHEMLSTLEEELCIDRARIFAMGHHDGAGFVRRLMCEVPLSGVVLTGFAELVDDRWCTPNPPVPTMWVVGEKDDFVPIEGGRSCTGGHYPRADDFDAVWRQRNRCSETGETWLQTDLAKCTAYVCEATYVGCRAQGGHHLRRTDWSLMFPLCSRSPLQFDVAKHGWAFFTKFGAVRSTSRKPH